MKARRWAQSDERTHRVSCTNDWRLVPVLVHTT